MIRHGQTDWNKERRIMGDQPIGLNETGRKQVGDLAQYLTSHSVDHLFASPLQRTQETAQILNAQWKLPLQLERDLREIEYGDWVGKTFQEIKAETGHFEYYRNPDQPICANAESLEVVRQRAVGVIERLRKVHSKGRIALVSHADWIKCVILHYLKIPLSQIYQFRIDNASVSSLTLEKDRERIIAVNHSVVMDPLFIPRDPL